MVTRTAGHKHQFDAYDAGKAELLFLTNCKRNDGQFERVKQLDVSTFHLEKLIQHVLDDLDGAVPRTPDSELQHIGTTLSPPIEETGGVSTTIGGVTLAVEIAAPLPVIQ